MEFQSRKIVKSIVNPPPGTQRTSKDVVRAKSVPKHLISRAHTLTDFVFPCPDEIFQRTELRFVATTTTVLLPPVHRTCDFAQQLISFCFTVKSLVILHARTGFRRRPEEIPNRRTAKNHKNTNHPCTSFDASSIANHPSRHRPSAWATFSTTRDTSAAFRHSAQTISAYHESHLSCQKLTSPRSRMEAKASLPRII